MTYENQQSLLLITQKVFELMQFVQNLEVTIEEMSITLHNVRIGGHKLETENV